MAIKRLFWIMILALSVFHAFAQMKVEAPEYVRVGDKFKLVYSVEDSDAIGFGVNTLPDVFDVNMGPSLSRQSGYINGPSNILRTTISYTYILTANKKGTFIIPPAYVTIRGEKITSDSVMINVCDSIESLPFHRSAKKYRTSADSLFIEWVAAKDAVYVGDTVRCECWVYTLKELIQLEGSGDFPDDCFIEECELPSQKTFSYKERDSTKYRAVKWSEIVITPTKTGKVTIGGKEFHAICIEENKNIDPFEAFFGGGFIEVQQAVFSRKTTITVLPKPEQDNMVELSNNGNGVYVLMDISSSTRMLDFDGMRFNAEKTMAKKLHNSISELGFLSFDAEPEYFVDCFSNNDRSNIINYLDTVAKPVNDATSVSDALLFPLLKTNNVKDIIVLCDGMDNVAHVSLNTALTILKNTGVRVNMVCFNSGKDSCNYEMSVSDSISVVRQKNDYLDKKTMNNLSKRLRETGGRLYCVKSEKDIEKYVQEITKNIKTKAPRRKTKSNKVSKILVDKLRKELMETFL